jgi:hypothetical protein
MDGVLMLGLPPEWIAALLVAVLAVVTVVVAR